MSQADTSWLGHLKLGLRTVRDLAFLPRLRGDKARLDAVEETDALVDRICLRKRRKGIVRANQNPVEIGELFRRVAAWQPKVIVEIGTSKGGTLYLWSRAIAKNGTLVSIDLPGGCGTVTASHRAVYRTFGENRGIDTHTISLNSHTRDARRKLEAILAGRPVDFLFIDGDHSYDGVSCDFREYATYVAPGGLIAMHDVAIPETDPTIQVSRFWNELQQDGLATEEIVGEPGHSPGIGVVTWRPANWDTPAFKRSA